MRVLYILSFPEPHREKNKGNCQVTLGAERLAHPGQSDIQPLNILYC